MAGSVSCPYVTMTQKSRRGRRLVADEPAAGGDERVSSLRDEKGRKRKKKELLVYQKRRVEKNV